MSSTFLIFVEEKKCFSMRLVEAERIFKSFLYFEMQVRCCWDFNGSDQSTKSSSWRKHMWFLVKKALGN